METLPTKSYPHFLAIIRISIQRLLIIIVIILAIHFPTSKATTNAAISNKNTVRTTTTTTTITSSSNNNGSTMMKFPVSHNNNNVPSLDASSSDDESSSTTTTTTTLTSNSGTDDDDEHVRAAPAPVDDDEVLVRSPHVGRKKVLVTGGAGFIGSHVAAALLDRGDDVVVIDQVNDYYDVTIKEANLQSLRDKAAVRTSNSIGSGSGKDRSGGGRLKIYRGDICDAELMERIFRDEKPGWVCHMAARAGVRPSIQDPFVYIHSNIRGTTLLLELAAKHGVQNFVFASSSSVYGGSKATLFAEDQVVDHPVSPYAASKKACELLAYTYHHLYELNVSALRFFTVYGPRGRPDMAPFKFIDRISRGQEIQQFGDGSSSRDYTYIDDIVDGVVRAIDRPYPYQVFNLGKGHGTSLSDFIGLVQKHVGRRAVVKVLPDQPGDVPYTCADVSKARRLLGYQATVSFEEGIRRTVEWYKNSYAPKQKQQPQTVDVSSTPALSSSMSSVVEAN